MRLSPQSGGFTISNLGMFGIKVRCTFFAVFALDVFGCAGCPACVCSRLCCVPAWLSACPDMQYRALLALSWPHAAALHNDAGCGPRAHVSQNPLTLSKSPIPYPTHLIFICRARTDGPSLRPQNFCAVINPPQAAILAVGTSVKNVVPGPDGEMKVSHGFQLQSLWIFPAAAVS